MATVTGFTADRMKKIEDETVVDGDVVGDNLILKTRAGVEILAGNVRGHEGIQGIPGNINVSPAGGALTGNYPNPTIAEQAIRDEHILADHIDGLANVPSMRTLGTGARQAAAGNHVHPVTAIVVGKSSAQTLTAGVVTRVVLNEIKDAGVGGLTLTSGVVKIPSDGWYHMSGNITFAESTSGARRILWIAKGATTTLGTSLAASSIGSEQAVATWSILSVSTTRYCLANEYVGLSAQAGTNWALEVAQDYHTNFSVHKV